MLNENDVHKAVNTIIEHTKDTVVQTLLQASARSELKLNVEEIPKVAKIIIAAIDKGYSEACPNFEKVLKRYLEQELPKEK